MTKTEFLAASLPYGAKFINKVTYEDAVMLLHGVIFDELHTQPNRKLYDVMTKGSGDARMQPLYLSSLFIAPITASLWKLYNLFHIRDSLKPI